MKLNKLFLLIIIILSAFSTKQMYSQILFANECFIGGVATCGMDYTEGENKKCVIKWEDDYSIKEVYALTYRYGRPVPYVIQLNNTDIEWNLTNQAGPEQIETNSASQFFAPHAINITENIEINNDTLIFNFPSQSNPLNTLVF